MQVGMEFEVAPDRQIKVKRLLLEHHADTGQRFRRVAAQVDQVNGDVTLVGNEHARQQLEQGRLASAVGPQQGAELASHQLEADIFKRPAITITFTAVFD